MTPKQIEDAWLNNIVPINRLWNSLAELIYMITSKNESSYRMAEARKDFGLAIVELLKLK